VKRRKKSFLRLM